MIIDIVYQRNSNDKFDSCKQILTNDIIGNVQSSVLIVVMKCEIRHRRVYYLFLISSFLPSLCVSLITSLFPHLYHLLLFSYSSCPTLYVFSLLFLLVFYPIFALLCRLCFIASCSHFPCSVFVQCNAGGFHVLSLGAPFLFVV